MMFAAVYVWLEAPLSRVCKMQTELSKFPFIVWGGSLSLKWEKTFYIVIKFQSLKVTTFMPYLHYYHDYT